MKNILFLFVFILLISCSKDGNMLLEKGNYRGLLEVDKGVNLPFNFDVINDSLLIIYNAKETIKVKEIYTKNDSIVIKTPVFEGYLIAKKENNTLSGKYIHESMNRTIPFSAIMGKDRFIRKREVTKNISGNWKTIFTNTETKNTYISKGIFEQVNGKVTGTFRTATGDYRFLDGIVDGDSLKLSTYDGARALLFLAKITDSTMNGTFYKGNHQIESFRAVKNENFELPNERNLVAIKRGYENFDFSFSDSKGRVVSLSDPEFSNKVIILQIMGSWCPNCLDESKFFKEFLENNSNKNVQVIALAFETAKTREKAYKRINELKQNLEIKYPVLLAQYGNEESKQKALEKLPMLTNLISYPTTIYLDKNKKVRKIESGFNGPATGKAYENFKKEFTSFIEKLSSE